ncbi:MAG: hypothetical protein ACQEQ4_03360 [Fibrobacterota bacterium]
MKSDAYARLDGTLSRSFFESLILRLSVENILDEHTVIFQKIRKGELVETIDPDRIFAASLTYRF